MASVEKRIRNGNTTWLARWRDPDGSQRKRSFPRKVDADRYLTSIESRMRTGTYVDPSLGKITVGEWARKWLEGQVHLKESTRIRYEGLLRNQILPHWKNVPLASVMHADVAAWVASLTASGLRPSSVRQAHRVLSLAMNLAVRDGRLSRNAAEGVPLPRLTRSEKRFLTHDDVMKLTAACGRYGLVIQVLAYTGIRWGELAALRVKRVDLLRRELTIAESATEVSGRVVFSTPKTHQVRWVPIPREIEQALAEQIRGKEPDDFVFTSPNGDVLRLNNFRRRYFDRAASAAGLEGLTPHELRHTAASLAVDSGADSKDVQRMLGHASAAMTMDVYAGLFEHSLVSVADRMDAEIAAARSRVPPACPGGDVVPLDDHRKRHRSG